MKWNKKLKAFTLSEMIVVMILTSIVAGLAFSVLSLVQRHMKSIQNNFNGVTELNLLEQSLWLDFNRFPTISYDDIDNELLFFSELDSKIYSFHDTFIVKDRDTFYTPLEKKTIYMDGNAIKKGAVDAIKLQASKAFQKQHLFVFKINDAKLYMD